MWAVCIAGDFSGGGLGRGGGGGGCISCCFGSLGVGGGCGVDSGRRVVFLEPWLATVCNCFQVALFFFVRLTLFLLLTFTVIFTVFFLLLVEPSWPMASFDLRSYWR